MERSKLHRIKSSFWSIVGYSLLISVFASPFVFAYWFLTDPVSAITNTIGAYLWLIVVIIPGLLILIILWGFGVWFFGLFKSIYELIKNILS